MMKSLLCMFLILCVHHVTATLPHSVVKRGWCPSSSAAAPTSAVNEMASLKFLNLNDLSSFGIPSSVMICHSGTWGWSSFLSSNVTDGAPTRQATHFCSVNSSIAKFLQYSNTPSLQLPIKSKLRHHVFSKPLHGFHYK